MNHSQLFDLTGRTALITDASSGLAEQFAIYLPKAVARVIVTARRISEPQELRKALGNANAVEIYVSASCITVDRGVSWGGTLW